VRDTLTEKQAAVLEFIRRRADCGEPPPTNREICDEFGWRSTRSARDHLRALKQKSFVQMSSKRSHRRVRLVDEPVAVAGVPIVGRVAAGLPVETGANFEGRVPVPAEWVDKGQYFAVRVDGDSMKDAGILEGDLGVARKQMVGNDGDIVLATLGGETTLKRLRRHRRGVSLVAANRRYRPIHVRSESAVIQGVIVGLLRAYRPFHRWHYRSLTRPAIGGGAGGASTRTSTT
jgi:repressor LexA